MSTRDTNQTHSRTNYYQQRKMQWKSKAAAPRTNSSGRHETKRRDGKQSNHQMHHPETASSLEARDTPPQPLPSTSVQSTSSLITRSTAKISHGTALHTNEPNTKGKTILSYKDALLQNVAPASALPLSPSLSTVTSLSRLSRTSPSTHLSLPLSLLPRYSSVMTIPISAQLSTMPPTLTTAITTTAAASTDQRVLQTNYCTPLQGFAAAASSSSSSSLLCVFDMLPNPLVSELYALAKKDPEAYSQPLWLLSITCKRLWELDTNDRLRTKWLRLRRDRLKTLKELLKRVLWNGPFVQSWRSTLKNCSINDLLRMIYIPGTILHYFPKDDADRKSSLCSCQFMEEFGPTSCHCYYDTFDGRCHAGDCLQIGSISHCNHTYLSGMWNVKVAESSLSQNIRSAAINGCSWKPHFFKCCFLKTMENCASETMVHDEGDDQPRTKTQKTLRSNDPLVDYVMQHTARQIELCATQKYYRIDHRHLNLVYDDKGYELAFKAANVTRAWYDDGAYVAPRFHDLFSRGVFFLYYVSCTESKSFSLLDSDDSDDSDQDLGSFRDSDNENSNNGIRNNDDGDNNDQKEDNDEAFSDYTETRDRDVMQPNPKTVYISEKMILMPCIDHLETPMERKPETQSTFDKTSSNDNNNNNNNNSDGITDTNRDGGSASNCDENTNDSYNNDDEDDGNDESSRQERYSKSLSVDDLYSNLRHLCDDVQAAIKKKSTLYYQR